MATQQEGQEPPGEAPHEASSRVQRYLALAIPVGMAVIAVGAVLAATTPRRAFAVIAAGMFVTWIGKRATHHTLTQPLGVLLLMVGIVLLLLRPFVGSQFVMAQLAITALAPGAVLATHGPRSGF